MSPRPQLNVLASLGLNVRPDGSAELPRDVVDLVKARTELADRLLSSAVPSVPLMNPLTSQGGAVGKGNTYNNGMVEFRTLRWLRASSAILLPIFEARQHQLRRFADRSYGQPGQVGWRVVHRDHRNPGAVVPRGIQHRIRKAEDVLDASVPHLRVHGMGDLLTGLWDDYATLNRPVLELLYDPWDGSMLRAVRPVDGANIWEASAYLSWWAAGNTALLARARSDRERLDLASAQLGVDLYNARYLYVEDHVVIRGLADADLIVGPALTSTDVRYGPYPPSKVERTLNLAVYADQILEYNSSFFTNGMLAAALLFVPPEQRDEAVSAFSQAYAQYTQGMRNAHQPAVIPADGDKIKLVPLQTFNPADYKHEVAFSLVASLTCAMFRIDPSTINIKGWDGGAGPHLNSPSRSDEIASAKEEGLSSDLTHLRRAIFLPLLRQIDPDLDLVFDTGDYDPEKELSILSKELSTFRTTNEVRVGKGLRPIGAFVADEDWDKASQAQLDAHAANVYNQVPNPSLGTASMVAQGIQQEQQASAGQAQAQAQGDGADGPDGAAGGDLQDDPQDGEDRGW